jgi:hypothetical protein
MHRYRKKPAEVTAYMFDELRSLSNHNPCPHTVHVAGVPLEYLSSGGYLVTAEQGEEILTDQDVLVIDAWGVPSSHNACNFKNTYEPVS